MQKLVIIGSDSFIAQKFIHTLPQDKVLPISRIKTSLKNEIVINDFKNISNTHFTNCDVVVNFAAIVHRPDIKDEMIYDEVNYQLAVLNAQKAKNAGVKLFIQMSTIAVYGNTNTISIRVSNNPINSYGISKLKADEILLKLQDESFKVAIVRPPMVYGGGKAPGNMLRLINLANKSIPLPFKGIDNKRDFIHVANLVQYLNIIANKKLDGIFLVTDHEPVSTEYLLRTIAKYLNKKVPLIAIPKFILSIIQKIRPNEYDKLFGSLHIETNFPFENLIQRNSVEQGIAEMVGWYKANK